MLLKNHWIPCHYVLTEGTKRNDLHSPLSQLMPPKYSVQLQLYPPVLSEVHDLPFLKGSESHADDLSESIAVISLSISLQTSAD